MRWREKHAVEYCWLGNLQEMMEEREVSQSEVAAAAGISRTMISKYGRCGAQCRRDVAERIAASLRVDPGEIITEGPFAAKEKDAG